MKKTILIVDDFENTRKVIQFSLKNIEYTDLTAGDGAEALKLFDGRDIDLLITDLNMPKMDGLELVRKVKKIEKYAFIPIIMLTTDRNPAKKQLAEDIKVTMWLQKPFEQERFEKIVRKCLR